MSKLRQAMIDAMLVRGFAVRTHQSYLSAVTGLAKYYRRSPVQLNTGEIQDYFLYLVKERHLSPASCRLSLNGIRFLYQEVLQREFEAKIQIPKRSQRIPELLTRKEVAAILEACINRKHRMLLTVCYGCGLRVSELLNLKVRDIDGERRLLRIDQGKGAKDRMVEIPETLLLQLRRYWQLFRPYEWLFPGRDPTTALGVTSAQKCFTASKCKAGVDKVGGIHSLRHAYATHQLVAGMPITQLQHQMGHKDIRTTLRYVHWVPNYQGGDSSTDLIADLEADHEWKK
ncbi:MAG: site-specific integrase [Pseudomonadota bacterium]|nr:site-specific integrase [Pseudomonadota bacterium]